MHRTNSKHHLLRLSRFNLRLLSRIAHRHGNVALGKRLADIYSAR